MKVGGIKRALSFQTPEAGTRVQGIQGRKKEGGGLDQLKPGFVTLVLIVRYKMCNSSLNMFNVAQEAERERESHRNLVNKPGYHKQNASKQQLPKEDSGIGYGGQGRLRKLATEIA